jgi:hypothetical protein
MGINNSTELEAHVSLKMKWCHRKISGIEIREKDIKRTTFLGTNFPMSIGCQPENPKPE